MDFPLHTAIMLSKDRVEPSTLNLTHGLRSSSFFGLPYRILNMNHKQALLRSLWVKAIQETLSINESFKCQRVGRKNMPASNRR